MSKKILESLTDQKLLALVLYGEARGEPPIGKLAVAHVILNRARLGGWYGANVREVILRPYQFSCFNLNDPNFSKLISQAERNEFDASCFTVASLALEGVTVDPTGGATHYHTLAIDPKWNDKMQFLKRINRHVFYREVK